MRALPIGDLQVSCCMFRTRLAFVVFSLLAGCASVEHDAPIHVMQYGCNDLVVVGRVRTLASNLIDDPRDLIGHDVWDIEVKIKRVIRGAEQRSVVPAVGVSHAQIRDDLDLLIVLSRSEVSSIYDIRTLNVWKGRSQLAATCTDMSE